MPLARGNFAAQFYHHPNGTRFIIVVGGSIGTNLHGDFTNDVDFYNVDEDSWFSDPDPGFNFPHNGGFYANFNGVMYENVFYLGCAVENPIKFHPEIYAFMLNGPDDFTWTKVGEVSIDHLHHEFACSSMELNSETLPYL